MPPPLIFGLSPRIFFMSTEILYFVIIVGLCLAIFWKTKEIEELTGHKGIILFRKIFMFFSLAFFVRLIHMIFIFYLGTNGLRATPILHRVILLPVAFFSTLALLYLLATVLVRHVKAFNMSNTKLFLIFVSMSALIILPTTYFRSNNVLIAAQLALIAVAGLHFATCRHKTKARKKQQFFNIKVLYILISIFWVLNIFVTSQSFQKPWIRLVVYITSIAIFGIIYYRVHQRLSVNG